ncbi:hypothetical protein [Pectobacterium sp. B1J-3]|uniref:hypothetical protein n=1 Tax=Pectobacterium sp. B1J-3 TaxID=3385371 RepID=UPI003906C668
MKPSTFLSALAIMVTIQGCTPRDPWYARWNDNCPKPTPSQLQKGGMLKLQDGITKQCQLKRYTSMMACSDPIVDSDGTDSLICNNGSATMLFGFDENGTLIRHSTHRKEK